MVNGHERTSVPGWPSYRTDKHRIQLGKIVRPGNAVHEGSNDPINSRNLILVQRVQSRLARGEPARASSEPCDGSPWPYQPLDCQPFGPSRPFALAAMCCSPSLLPSKAGARAER